MKFKVTMKDPDVLHDAIREAVKEDLASVEGLGPEEREILIDSRCEKVDMIAQKWFEYGEYLTIEIDTEAKTATVCERE